MNARAIAFVLLSTLVIFGSLLMRPPIDVGQNDAKNGESAVTQSDADRDQADRDQADPKPTDNPNDSVPAGAGDAVAQDTQPSTESSIAADPPETANADGADTPSEAASKADSQTSTGLPGLITLSDSEIEDRAIERSNANTAQENALLHAWSYTSPSQQGKLVTIGSLNKDGSDRYLITANSRGGTIRRIELNYRDNQGRYKYPDLDITYGYMGSLDCYDTAAGCIVGVVGPGTPAALATSGQQVSLQPGDRIVALAGNEISTRYDLELSLTKTKPGDKIDLEIERAGESLKFEVQLTRKPIELIRPEPGLLDPTNKFAESFSMSLLKPSADVQQNWQEISPDMTTADWEIAKVDRGGDQVIELKYRIDETALAAVGLEGPVTVVKRFVLPTIKTDTSKDQAFDGNSFHWELEIEFISEAQQDQQLGYRLVGPTGTPSETWWYANKIYGGNAFTAVAGARDVTASTPAKGYSFFSGGNIIDKVEDREPAFVISPFETVTSPESGKWDWVGVDSQYFNVSLVNAEQSSLTNNINAVTNGVEIPDVERAKRLVDCTALLFEKVSVPGKGGEPAKRSFQVFSGPKEPEALDAYGLDDNRAFGWFWWCSKPLLSLLHIFYWITGSISYGIAIILLTVLVRCIMIPLSRKAALNAQMMQALQPKMKEITEKYEDLQERGAAQRELFQKYNYNPIGGCWVMFIQLPVFLGLYRGLSVDIALRGQALIPGMAWCGDLSAPDKFLYWKNWMPGWLAGEVGWLGPYLNILPLFTIVLFLIQQRLFTPPAVDEQQKMMQRMMGFMMIFMGVMFFKVPSGLCLYFITSSIWGIIERQLLPKPVLDTSKLDLDSPATISKAEQKRIAAQKEAAEEKRKRNLERKRRLKKKNNKRN